MQAPHHRIGPDTFLPMMVVSIIFWLLSWIPVVSFFATPTRFVTFHMWFERRGAQFFKMGKSEHGGFFASGHFQIISFILGFLPFIITGILSAFPIVVYKNIRRVQKEDAAKIKAYWATADQRRAQEQEMAYNYLYQDEQEEDLVTPEDRPSRNVLAIQRRPLRPVGNKRAT